MRRGLNPGDLGDLFDKPLTAVMSIARPDGSVFCRPVWHRFVDGRFVFQFPAGDRKIAMLADDPRVTVLLAEDPFPYRAIEVRGHLRSTGDDYHRTGAAICEPYVQAYDPTADVHAYLSREPGVIVRLEADVTTCWDYADDAMMPPST
ncbi:MAG: pyridoxamine 5'-phosphate oxidase family protein [Candidatus Limnocylindrales bacterium]